MSERMHRGKMKKSVARSKKAHDEVIERILTNERVHVKTKVCVKRKRNSTALEVVFGGAKGRRQFNYHQMVQISIEKTSCLMVLARNYNCSARTVGRIRDVVAYGLISLQELSSS